MIKNNTDKKNERNTVLKKSLVWLLIVTLMLTLVPNSYTAKASGGSGNNSEGNSNSSSEEEDEEDTDKSKTVEVNDAKSLFDAFADEKVGTIVVTCNIDISSAYENPKSKTAILTADRNLVLMSKGTEPYTIKRTNTPLTQKVEQKLSTSVFNFPTVVTTKTIESPYFQKSIIEVWGNGVEDGIIVSLKNITLDGGAIWPEEFSAPDMREVKDNRSAINSGVFGRAVVDVANMGTVNLESNCTIQNSDARTNSTTRNSNGTTHNSAGSWVYGGGVRVDYVVGQEGGHVNMKTGSLIKDCCSADCGGGIGAYNYGLVNMYGGKIERCASGRGGGIGLTHRTGSSLETGARINFHGGYVSSCFASTYGGGIYDANNSMACFFGGKIQECNTGYIGSLQVYGGAMYFGNTPILRLADAYTFKTSMITGLGNYDDSGFTSSNGIYIWGRDDIDTPESVTVTFKSEDRVLSELNFEIGSTAGEAVPMDLVRENYLFCGWYTDTEYTKHFNKKTKIEEETTVYAKWAYLTSADSATGTYSKESKFVNGDFSVQPFERFTLSGKDYKERTDTEVGGLVSKVVPNGVDKGWNTTETYVKKGSLFEWLALANSDMMSNKNKAKYKGYDTYDIADYNPALKDKNKMSAVELTAVNCSALYQDFSSEPNDVLVWSFKHAMVRKPGEKDDGSVYQILKIEMGKPDGTPEGLFTGEGNKIKTNIKDVTKYIYTADKTVDYRNNEIYMNDGGLDGLYLSSKNGDDKTWHTVTGAYKVPEGQTATRFLLMQDDIMPGNGDMLTDFQISTVLGNVKAKKNSDGEVTITGFWGEKDRSKKMLISIGKKYVIVDMTKVFFRKGKCFTITLDSTFGADARSVKISHEDYDLANVLISFE